jgi:hypothetical protein
MWVSATLDRTMVTAPTGPRPRPTRTPSRPDPDDRHARARHATRARTDHARPLVIWRAHRQNSVSSLFSSFLKIDVLVESSIACCNIRAVTVTLHQSSSLRQNRVPTGPIGQFCCRPRRSVVAVVTEGSGCHRGDRATPASSTRRRGATKSPRTERGTRKSPRNARPARYRRHSTG